MELSIQYRRLRQIREELNQTQSSFAEQLGVGSTTTEYERGRTKLTGKLILRLLSDYKINPLWLYGESEQKYLDPRSKEVSPTVVTVDSDGFDNILMVNEKAAAGYTGNLENNDFFEQLPSFSFPIPEYRNATFRCFQVEGYSMVPTILPSEWIITKAVEDLSQIKDNKIYVVVDNDGIRIKQVRNELHMRSLTLISLNEEYGTELLAYDEVKEVWEFHSKLTKELAIQSTKQKLDVIYEDIKIVKAKILEQS